MPEMVYFVRHGYAVVSIEYRTAVQAFFPSQLEDVKLAIRFLRARAEEFGIISDKIAIMGESAGGHLAELVGTTGDTREFDKGNYLDQSSKVQAVMYGISNFENLPKIDANGKEFEKEYGKLDLWSLLAGETINNNKEKIKEMSPISYITKDTLPFLILHGSQDKLVPISQNEEFYDELQKAGVESDFYALVGVEHGDVHFTQNEVKVYSMQSLYIFKNIILSIFW